MMKLFLKCKLLRNIFLVLYRRKSFHDQKLQADYRLWHPYNTQYYIFKLLIILLTVIVVIVKIVIALAGFIYYPPLPTINTKEFVCAEPAGPIDIVYTWVNGSDPNFQAKIKELNLLKEVGQNRFYDFDQLKYSIRSIELYAPWYRNIIIVTNGQIPKWLNLDHERLRIITHNEIFINEDNLPTFNSLAIESHLHRIPELSKEFLYFNDDVALLRPVCYSDFYTKQNGVKLFPKSHVTTYGSQKLYNIKCPSSCASAMIGDGTCHEECKKAECIWDRGDCDGDLPTQKKFSIARLFQTFKRKEAYHRSVDYTNYLLDRKFNTTVKDRKWLPHMPFLINLNIMREIENEFGYEMYLTSSHKTRQMNDLQYEMMYTYYIIESKKYKYELIDPNIDVEYYSLRDNYFQNRYHLKRLRQNRKKYLCINDNMSSHNSLMAIPTENLVISFYDEFFPNTSDFEI